MLAANGIFFWPGVFTSCFGGAIPRWQVWYSPDDCFSNFYFSFTSVLSLFLPKAQLTFYSPLRPFCSPFAQPYFTAFLFILKLSRKSLRSLVEPGAVCWSYNFFAPCALMLSDVIHLYILWWANIYILTFFQILCNCVLVNFISFTAWVLTYSRLVGDYFNKHTHTHARACAGPYALKCFQTHIWTIAFIVCR